MRALVPELPRGAWTLVAGDAVSGIGSGLTLPFLLVYLHQVRGFGLGEAGLALSMVALAGFAGNPVGGSLVDRVGGRAALASGLAFSAAGSACLAFVIEPWQAYAAAATLGFGLAVVWAGANRAAGRGRPGRAAFERVRDRARGDEHRARRGGTARGADRRYVVSRDFPGDLPARRRLLRRLRPDPDAGVGAGDRGRSEEHTSELQSRENLVCRLLLEKKKK